MGEMKKLFLGKINMAWRYWRWVKLLMARHWRMAGWTMQLKRVPGIFDERSYVSRPKARRFQLGAKNILKLHKHEKTTQIINLPRRGLLVLMTSYRNHGWTFVQPCFNGATYAGTIACSKTNSLSMNKKI